MRQPLASAWARLALLFSTEPMWSEEVLSFWFEDVPANAWFARDEALDAEIGRRFAQLHEQLATGEISVPRTAQAHLAAVIVLDQFSRNMFRGTKRAFATDPQALRIASHAIDQNLDAGMTKTERQFLYMPYMHSEEPAMQDRCVGLFARLKDPELLKYATDHRDIIERFGRFPHRNEILQRQSTGEEARFMQDHKGF